MKKCLILLLMLIFLTACGTESGQKSKYEIVVIPQMWSEENSDIIQAHVKDLPELNVYQNTSEEPDALYQALLVEDLVAQEVDAICIDPVDPAAAAPMIEKARQAGIAVIVGDSIPQMIDEAAAALQ